MFVYGFGHAVLLSGELFVNQTWTDMNKYVNVSSGDSQAAQILIKNSLQNNSKIRVTEQTLVRQEHVCILSFQRPKLKSTYWLIHTKKKIKC